MIGSKVRLQQTFTRALALANAHRCGDGRYAGFHDGAKGVQWHLVEDAFTGNCYLGVNLEGLKYNGQRPIRKLLSRESRRPLLPAVLSALRPGDDVLVHVNREGWPGPRNRIYIKERFILDTVASLLSEDAWVKAMMEGLLCVGDNDERGIQNVTRLHRMVPERMQVLPHVAISAPVWNGVMPLDSVDRVRAARSLLLPVYEMMVEQVSAA